MTIRRKTIGDDQVGPEKLSVSQREFRYGFEPFNNEPFSWSAADGFGDPTGVTGDQNGLFTGYNSFLIHIKGTQTILVPKLTTSGFYDFGYDQVEADGFELRLSGNNKYITGGDSPRHYTLGVDEGCFFRLLFSVADVSGLDLTLGFRKVEAAATTVAAYTDYAAIRVFGDPSSAAGAITLISSDTSTDDDAVATTDTLADATDVEFKVEVHGRTAKFFINGAAPSVDLTDYEFNTGAVIEPFVFALNTTDVMGVLDFKRMEWGLLKDQSDGVLTAV